MGCRYVVGGINADAKLQLHWTMVITATRMVSMVGSMDGGDVFVINNCVQKFATILLGKVIGLVRMCALAQMV